MEQQTSSPSNKSQVQRQGKKLASRQCKGQGRRCCCDHIVAYEISKSDSAEVALERIPKCILDLGDASAIAVWRREQLLAVLRCNITTFWKSEAPQGLAWNRCCLSQFKDYVRQITYFTKLSSRMGRFVQKWICEDAVQKSRDPVGSDRSVQEKEHRLEFWAKYRHKTEKSDLPMLQEATSKKNEGPVSTVHRETGRCGAPKAMSIDKGPLETHGAFWRPAISSNPLQDNVTKTRRRRSLASQNSKDKPLQRKVKQNMSWTKRVASDTQHQSDRRWVLGQQFRPPEDASNASAQGVAQQHQHHEKDRHFIRLVPDAKGAEDAKLVYKKMDRLKRRESQCSEQWESQIASAIQPKAERQLSDGSPNSWAITGVRPNSSSTSTRSDELEVSQNHIHQRNPEGNKRKMSSKSESLPNLPQRAAYTSMYRQRAVHKKSIADSPLPPIPNAFKEHSPPKASPTDPSPSPTKRYVKVCHKFGIIPSPMPFMTGLSTKLDASDRALNDNDLFAVAAMIRSMECIEEVDLEGNTLLTDKALVAFLRKLFGPPALATLKRLSLKGCCQAGRMPSEVIVDLLSSSEGLHALNQLDLSGVQIAMSYHLPLASAVCGHPRLSVLSLADTGVGTNPNAKHFMAKLLSSTTLQTLDLGWNTLSTDVFLQIGESVVETQVLKSLSIANCAAASSESAKPVMYFLEYLARDRCLECLDVSMNRLDFHDALVLEDALETHRRLKTVCISQNPLGALGLRSILRLLARESSGLLYLVCDSCFALSEPLAGTDIFRVSFPVGSYALSLDRPYHRSMLRMVYKTCERLGIQPVEAFADIESSVPRFRHPEGKDKVGIWPVPYLGKLSFNFTPLKAMDLIAKSENVAKLDPHLDEFTAMLKLKPTMRKMAPLLALWQAIDGRMQEQTAMLEAISRDFLFSYPQVEQICRSRFFACKAISNLLHCVSSGEVGRYLCLQLLPTLAERMAVRKIVDKFLELNIDNPTGHYVLDLSVPLDLGIAERLVLLDTWELRLLQQREDYFDTSQQGNSSHFRNEQYQKQALSNLGLPTMAEWCLPGVGVLEFDYASSRRPPQNVAILGSIAFRNLVKALRRSSCEPADKVQSLRKVSAEIWLTSLQLRQLVMGLRSRDIVDDIIVVLFFRIQDIWNEKLFRARCQNLESLYHRLGYFNFFPFFQMEHEKFHFDFVIYEQRAIASHLVHMSRKEIGSIIKNLHYEHADGTKDSFPMGIPRGWDSECGLPRSGTFSATYVCSSESSHFAERRRVCERFSRWHISIRSSLDPSFSHWCTLSHAPPDVITYLKAVKARYVDTQAAFRAIDGIGGNGVINLQEFIENLQDLGCPILLGLGGKQRAVDVFRYFDANDSGTLSKQEWAILDHLWNEVSLSIKEFYECIAEVFKGDLLASWDEIDEDGNGTLDEQEWRAASQKFGYLGPAKDIFHFLDTDSQGVVTLLKFLSKGYPQVPPRRSEINAAPIDATK